MLQIHVKSLLCQLTIKIIPDSVGPVKFALAFMKYKVPASFTGIRLLQTHRLFPSFFSLWITSERPWMLYLPNSGRL